MHGEKRIEKTLRREVETKYPAEYTQYVIYTQYVTYTWRLDKERLKP